MPTSTMALLGRFLSLMGRFPTLMGRFPDFVLVGRFTSSKSTGKQPIKKRGIKRVLESQKTFLGRVYKKIAQNEGHEKPQKKRRGPTLFFQADKGHEKATEKPRNGGLGRGCDEAKIGEEKQLFTEWGPAIQ